MPYKNPPKCVQCEKTESPLWRTLDLGVFCQECFEKNEAPNEIKTEETDATGGTSEPVRTGKKTRNRAAKATSNASNKGKGRRCIFKRQPFKTPTMTATITTRDSIFYNDIYMQKGDIVSLQGDDDNLYYAQVRGFMVDTFLEKSAVISWLIPSNLSPPPNESFDPCTYLIGPEEEFPRKLDTMKFVMHAPHDYYLTQNSPYPVKGHSDGEQNFIWTKI